NYRDAIADCEKVLTFINTDIDERIAEGCTTAHSAALLRMAKAYKELGDMDACRSAMTRRNAIENRLGRDRLDASSESINDRKSAEESARVEQRMADEWRERGNAAYKDGEFSKALQFYKQGLSFSIYDTKLHGNACMCLIKLRKWEQALKHANQCILLEPDWVKGYYLKAQILAEQSKLDAAESTLLTALEKDKDSIPVNMLLQQVRERRSKSSLLKKRATITATTKSPGSGPKAWETDPILDLKKISNLDDLKSISSAATKGEGIAAGPAGSSAIPDASSDNGDDVPVTFKQYLERVLTRKFLVESGVELLVALVGVFITWYIIKHR
ncbi:hypothetical protein EV182_003598, partial [Spiromyces aspiralis]